MPASSASQFHQQLVATFSLDEIEQLCFDLNIEYEELGAETRSAKACKVPGTSAIRIASAWAVAPTLRNAS